MKLVPFGDRAVRFALPPPSSSSSRRALLFDALSSIDGVRDVILTEEVGCVIAKREIPEAAIVRALQESAVAAVADESPGTTHTIEVVYDGEDLDAIAAAANLRDRDAVIALHSASEYRVAMLGFLPGFAYLRGLPPELAVLPRRSTPRPRVDAQSVAIAAEYTGIYPFASPGGWHLLGHAPRFEAFRERATLAIGDVVRFVSVPAKASSSTPAPPMPPGGGEGPHLEIARAMGMVLFVDGQGRAGRMHEGMPPGGPLVRSLFDRACGLVGNADDATACAIEVSGSIEVIARGGSFTIADDSCTVPIILHDGDRHVVTSSNERARTRARYLAIEGGCDAPMVLGSRSTLLVAGIGRLLRRGDRIRAGSGSSFSHSRSPSHAVDLESPIAIMQGPDEAAGIDLRSTTFTISSTSDRTGTRLMPSPSLSSPAPQAPRASTPMVMGAIEQTPSGLIVFGPDHPTTGGYPVIGVIRERSLDAFFARPIGSSVRFVLS